MTKKVAIAGVGYSGFRSVSPDVSYREMIFEAAVKAYMDAGVEPKDIDSFITATEDFIEGYSIADEYTPDQLGAVLKSVHTVTGDFIHALNVGCMMILTNAFNVVAIESHCKASNLVTPTEIVSFGLDPVLNRPLNETPYFVAGLDMNRYMYETGTTKEHCAKVVVKNKANALLNPYAAYGAKIEVSDVLDSQQVSYPLNKLDISPHADGAVVVVLASDEVVNSLTNKPVWIKGMGWCNDAPSLETREWGDAVYARLSAEMAYKMAKISCPRKEIDFVEINDEFSYKELQHLEALKLCQKGEAKDLINTGCTSINGCLPVNPSGGSLGVGHLFEASGAQKVLELVLQIRGTAGERQIKNANTGLALAWRGIPSTSGAVVILGKE